MTLVSHLFTKRGHDSLFTGDKKGEFVYLFLSLSFSHFTMNHKEPTSLLSTKIETDISNYGKIDTIESIH
jgi:hypothetical protein